MPDSLVVEDARVGEITRTYTYVGMCMYERTCICVYVLRTYVYMHLCIMYV